MKKIVLAIASFLSVQPCLAADYLEPEPSIYGGDAFSAQYDSIVVSVLHAAYDRDVVLRMLAEPSFGPEFAVGLKGAPNGPYQIFTLQPSVHLWGYETVSMLKSGEVKVIQGDANKEIQALQSHLPRDPKDVAVTSCFASVDSATAARISAVWEKMLRATHFPDHDTMGLDGEIFHFAMRAKFQFLAGQVWSPPEQSPAGMLVAVAGAMKAHCEKHDNQTLVALGRAVDALAGKLN